MTETRGCLFDMNGFKAILFTRHINHKFVKFVFINTPTIQLYLIVLKRNLIDSVQKELKKINKGLYYQMIDITKKYPIYLLFISF